MKKNIKSAAGMIALAVMMIISQTQAQTVLSAPPAGGVGGGGGGGGDQLPLPMLRSKDALRTYATEQATNVMGAVSAQLDGGAGSYSYAQLASPTAASVINAISSMNLSVNVVDPSEFLVANARAWNTDWDELFTGFHWFHLEKAGSSWGLPEDYGNVAMEMVDKIPISMPNAYLAQIVVFDLSGQVKKSEVLTLKNGKLYYPGRLAGTNAILMVDTTNSAGLYNGRLAWNVTDGLPIQPLRFNAPVEPTIKGIVTIKDADYGDAFVRVPTRNGVGTNLTVEYTSTKDWWRRIGFETTEGKPFRGAWFRKAGEMSWNFWEVNASLGDKLYIAFWATEGVRYIIPVWDPADLTEP